VHANPPREKLRESIAVWNGYELLQRRWVVKIILKYNNSPVESFQDTTPLLTVSIPTTAGS
jgi:hypothetical protein